MTGDGIRRQAFLHACRHGQLAAAQGLHTAGLDVHFYNGSAFRRACENGQLAVARWLHDDVGGVDVHVNHDSALHGACKNGHLAVARWLHEADGNELTIGVAGRGPAGVLGAYAALFETSISEVMLVDPPKSHREGPTLLNVLRVFDIPDAIGLLAPRHLTLFNADSDTFNRTEQIYKAAGYESRITRKPLKK